MNILILSVGTRNKLIQYFKQELNGIGKVYAADCSKHAPALYEADEFFIVPRITHDHYLEHILALCQVHQIHAVFSLIDPELSLLAANHKRFEAIGVTPIISKATAIEMAFNKYLFYQFCKMHEIETIKTYHQLEDFICDHEHEDIDFPVFVKPINGSASINIQRVDNLQALTVLFEQYDDLIIQEFMHGQEIGVDVYVDLYSKEVVSIFAKEKITMRAGETDKSRSFKDQYLFDIIKDFIKHSGFVGMIDFDIFKRGNDYVISEVNPRFGGGYLHAFEAGVNFPRLLINNLQGKINPPDIGQYSENTYMMKYNDVLFHDYSLEQERANNIYILKMNEASVAKRLTSQ